LMSTWISGGYQFKSKPVNILMIHLKMKNKTQILFILN